jgi:flagellar hook-associated protein 1
MLAQQSSISVAANNVSNVNTPGYSRQRAELTEGAAIFNGSQMVGTGVKLQQITSLRNKILELRLQDEKRQQGSLQAQVGALGDLDLQFSIDNENIGDALNSFFSSLSNLSPDPSNISLRQSVLMSAQNLVNQFHSASDVLHQRQFSLDLEVQQTVSEVNQITGQIADLNHKISTGGMPEEQIGSYVDERNLLLQDLSSLIGTHVITADDGLSVTTGNGAALVVGDHSYPLTAAKDANGLLQLSVAGTNVGSQATAGKIYGLLQVREQVIPGVLSQLDAIASHLITSFNAVHQAGTDLDGAAGGTFFVPAPASGIGAAASIALAISDPRQLAASGDGSAGDNSNLNALIAVNEQAIVNGDRLVDAYAKVSFSVGSQLSNAKADLHASEAMVQQLQDQRGAISGVSLDEEASNLIRFQRAYEAAARVVSVISDLTEISVNLGR